MALFDSVRVPQCCVFGLQTRGGLSFRRSGAGTVGLRGGGLSGLPGTIGVQIKTLKCAFPLKLEFLSDVKSMVNERRVESERLTELLLGACVDFFSSAVWFNATNRELLSLVFHQDCVIHSLQLNCISYAMFMLNFGVLIKI